ncbi:hypothetical protein PV10_02102 [Exophiala mesophila]|uniref:Uncharacterized protein n=1 Tax=Exophiala mesophila TaxID=212818 RepID=A0A0D2A5P4_EXOME|nr:uncharacterized protein PV10_02102 [Exophiala mesophila]KIV94328.1 hypothetical protein PV10_02102 [Exophiala mesophila]
MSPTARHPLPGTPSTRSHAGRSRQKVSIANSTAASSATTSPAPSTEGSHLSVDISTSVSDLDDYAEHLLPASLTSAGMKLPSVNHKPPHTRTIDHRRSSGRVRKPSVKARAQSEDVDIDGSASQILESETIVIGGTPSSRQDTMTGNANQPLVTDPAPASHHPLKSDHGHVVARSDVPRRNSQVVDAAMDNGTPQSTLMPSPTRRSSARERKPTLKVLEIESPTPKKRSPPEAEDPRPTKTLKITITEPKMPSKLRFSLSSSAAETDRREEEEPMSVTEPRQDSVHKPSKIVRLSVPRLGQWLQDRQNAKNPPRLRLRLSSQRQTRTSESSSEKKANAPPKARKSKVAKTKPIELAGPASCSLACLSDSARLLAMAEIALMMPDSDNEDEQVVPGSAQDWKSYTAALCQCANPVSVSSSRTNSVELLLALEPNKVAATVPQERDTPVEMTKDIFQMPVNTILNADESRRVHQLLSSVTTEHASNPGERAASDPTAPSPSAGFSPVTRRNGKGRATEDVSEVNGSIEASGSGISMPMYAGNNIPLLVTPKKTYEDRLREDHVALSEIRNKATSLGIHWTFNMTFDHIHELVMQVEDKQESLSTLGQTVAPEKGREASPDVPKYDAAAAKRWADINFPPWTDWSAHRATEQPTASSKINEMVARPTASPRTSSVANKSLENGEGERRPRSSSKAKSSHFRVDPRGLLGESPGPGTIINITQKKAGARQHTRKSRRS